jgi:hypothetical protein
LYQDRRRRDDDENIARAFTPGNALRRPPRGVHSACYLAHDQCGEAETFEDFRGRLRCRHCGSEDVSTVVETPYVQAAEG